MKSCEYNDELSSIMTPEETKSRSYGLAEEASAPQEDQDAIHITVQYSVDGSATEEPYYVYPENTLGQILHNMGLITNEELGENRTKEKFTCCVVRGEKPLSVKSALNATVEDMGIREGDRLFIDNDTGAGACR